MSNKGSGLKKAKREWGKPYSVFEREQLARGQTPQQVETYWEDLIKNEQADREWVNNEWVVFEGVIRDRYEDEGTTRNAVRNERVASSDDLREAAVAADKVVARNAQAIASSMSSMDMPTVSRQPAVNQADVAFPCRPHFEMGNSSTVNSFARSLDAGAIAMAKMDEDVVKDAATRQAKKLWRSKQQVTSCKQSATKLACSTHRRRKFAPLWIRRTQTLRY